MPRRSGVGLEAVADWENLSRAFWRAAAGKRLHAEVQRFAQQLDARLADLGRAILDGSAPEGRYRSFYVFDPKRRRILAPCFADRVRHHALMAQMGPILDRALVSDTFACRVGKGCLAAVQRAQQHTQRFAWYVKADITGYFAHIEHERLMGLLARRFKHPDLLALCQRILTRTPDGPPRGLPIGALTSQHFANLYLDGLDRFLLEQLQVRGLVRYMDDSVWWCDSHAEARETLAAVCAYAQRERGLTVKPTARIGRSAQGVPFLGFRVLPSNLRLSLRRRRRYAAARARCERAWRLGLIDDLGLQAGMAAALAITAHADATGWRRNQLARRGSVDA